MDNIKKREFQDNNKRKARIRESMKQYHYNLRHGGILTEDYFDFENIVGDDRAIVEDKYLQITNNIQSQFIKLLTLIDQRRELITLMKVRRTAELNSENAKNKGKKIHISPEQRDRIFEPDKAEEEEIDD